MIQHYLKIAIRNLLKYRMQTLISIIGLTVGFVSFSLSGMWMNYEQSYDNFHDGADRVYVYSILPRCFDTDPENINESVQLMNKAIYAELTARSGLSVVYLDVYNSFLDKDGSLNMNLSYDGLHLNPEGYEILTKALNKKIQ